MIRTRRRDRTAEPVGLRDYALRLADATGEVLDRGELPIVLGGDCSILLGNLLALSRRGRHGLLFIDGHADFYQPEAEPNGEAASMDLALATGRGPGIVADLEGRIPLVRDEDVVQLGRRDADEAEQRAANASRRPASPSSTCRRCGSSEPTSPRGALERLPGPSWTASGSTSTVTHSTTPSCRPSTTDSRRVSWAELETVIRAAIRSGQALGLEVTIFNPALDNDGSIASALVSCLVGVLGGAGRSICCAPLSGRCACQRAPGWRRNRFYGTPVIEAELRVPSTDAGTATTATRHPRRSARRRRQPTEPLTRAGRWAMCSVTSRATPKASSVV